MNALRRFLSRSDIAIATRWLRGLALAVLLARALIPAAVMLDPNPSDAGIVVLCSGHGPLIVDATVRMAGFPGDASNVAAADTPAHDGHGMPGGHSMSSGFGGGLCPFGAALFAALTSCLLLWVPLFPAAAWQAWTQPVVRTAVRTTIGDRPPSRAPPRLG